MPAADLRGLGAAMRVLAWEDAGLDVHRQHGLPAAREALGGALLAHQGRQPAAADTSPSLLSDVLRLLIRHFAWAGRRDLAADVVLGEPDEDVLVEELAKFLWANRDRVDLPDQRPSHE